MMKEKEKLTQYISTALSSSTKVKRLRQHSIPQIRSVMRLTKDVAGRRDGVGRLRNPDPTN